MKRTERTEIARTKARAPLPRIPDHKTGMALQHRNEGKTLREQCARSGHSDLGRSNGQRDPLTMLHESNKDRIKSLVPMRHSRMMESPFAFFRGSAIVQANDLSTTPSSGIRVQLCGDCHLMNFGGFATPERQLIFDINDFDETFPGPWEWDIKRLCVSLVLAARWRGFDKAAALEAVNTAVARYRRMSSIYADMPTMDVWYSDISFADMLHAAGGDRRLKRLLGADVRRAQRSTSEHVYGRITHEVAGTVRIIDQPPLLFHPRFDLITTSSKFFAGYAKTLRDDYRLLIGRFQLIDAALKVVGVGSVGTRCFIALFAGEQEEPFFLQVKEARRSVLENQPGQSPSRWRNHGERVVAGQHLMQAASDIFLGWARGPGNRDYYVRQLRDMKVAFEIDQFDAAGLAIYGRLCGTALARAHAKAGQAARIAGYLGKSGAFDEAIGPYSLAYADQVESDYETFRAAISRGEFATETSRPIMETTIA